MVAEIDSITPSSNAEMYKVFAPVVEKWVSRLNKVPNHHEDLVQHVWERLLAVKVLDKYHQSWTSIPQKFTGPQVANLMGLTYSDWRDSMWRGESPSHWTPILPKPPEEGVHLEAKCSKCGCDMASFEKSLLLLRGVEQLAKVKEVASLGLNPMTHNFWGVMEGNVLCVFCSPRKYGEGLALTAVNAPWWSEKAFFSKREVESLLGGKVDWSVGRARCPFKGYLALSVSNTVKNWFRTKERRHQELPQEVNPVTGSSWEDTLVDTKDVPIEVRIDLQREIERLSKKRGGTSHMRSYLYQAGL